LFVVNVIGEPAGEIAAELALHFERGDAPAAAAEQLATVGPRQRQKKADAV
jgi:hypothetical protein